MATEIGTETTIHPCEPAFKDDGQGGLEQGEYFFVEQVHASGALRASYEYNLYYWSKSQHWEGDVISPHGWHDIDEDEVVRIARSCGIIEAELRANSIH